MLKVSKLHSQVSDLVEIRSRLSFNVCSRYLKIPKGLDQKQPFSTLYVYILDAEGQLTLVSMVQVDRNLN